MSSKFSRRDFVVAGATAGIGVAAAPEAVARRPAGRDGGRGRPPTRSETGPTMTTRQGVRPVVISDYSGLHYSNGGPRVALEEAFERIARGEDVLESVIAGVNIVENDPTETGVGFGGLPNEDGIVQLDACCMHGPLKRAGGVAALEGVRTPSSVAKAVADFTDHHLLVGEGAQRFARQMGFPIEDDLNTPRSRELWLEWRRRVDPDHYLDPAERRIRGREAGLAMLREGLIDEHTFWGTIHCAGINAAGDICAVTTTSGLAWKIPGRAGDSPILGAGLYVDGGVGSCGSTGRGEANLFNLTSFLVVENLRRGMSPKDAGLEGLRRIRENTIEERLLNERGEPAFNVRFFVLNANGEYAGVAMYAVGETTFGVCTEDGAQELPLEPLLEGAPRP